MTIAEARQKVAKAGALYDVAWADFVQADTDYTRAEVEMSEASAHREQAWKNYQQAMDDLKRLEKS
jgi:molybdopterin synthase catalytic subunit